MAMKPEDQALYEETVESLRRIQDFDADKLSRKESLGEHFHLEGAVEPAKRHIELYRQLPTSILEVFPNDIIKSLKDLSHNLYNLLEEAMSFVPDGENPTGKRNQIINRITKQYDETFKFLHPLISYSLHRSADFPSLERNARDTIQEIHDQAEMAMKELNKYKEDADQVLQDVREAAAEHGVTQQAIYFKEEADGHNSQSNRWLLCTSFISLLLLAYAVVSVFSYKILGINPTDTYQMIQLGISKVLIFGVISYGLYLSARNFLSHKHNTIINRHRQNALMTYKALVEASGQESNREVITLQAAGCIFSPQSTGYTKESGIQSPSAKSMMELLIKPLTKNPEG